MATLDQDTIAAIATPPGRGGVGIVRVSGPAAATISLRLVGKTLTPRHAHYGPFFDHQGQLLDEGIALYFPGPHSFTGEDVLELQGHGGPVILDLLLQACLAAGARLARPGEFSERAFLNDKLDLAQAEAIADLIDAHSAQAARNAVRSLQGAFSQQVQDLVEALIALRIYVESAIDFPEEEIDFLSDGHVQQQLENWLAQLAQLLAEAEQGVMLREGATLVFAGKPNAGKSSLLNQLAGQERAIVTDIAGTTRDVLREHIVLDGLPLTIIDTAGLRASDDPVEQEGVRRAWREIEQADWVVLLSDSTDATQADPEQLLRELISGPGGDPAPRLPHPERITLVRNKADLSGLSPGPLPATAAGQAVFAISATRGDGLAALREHLKAQLGYRGSSEGSFSARRRHVDALHRAQTLAKHGLAQLQQQAAGELLAEDLRLAQQALGEITGEFSADDLLGRIFTSFCIGK